MRAGKLDFMNVLLNIPKETIRKKQLAIAYHAPKLQYAMPPPELLKNRSDATPWDPPFKDGVEVAIDGMFERTQHIVKNESTGIPHRLMQSREWSREYDVVKVKVPGDEYAQFAATYGGFGFSSSRGNSTAAGSVGAGAGAVGSAVGGSVGSAVGGVGGIAGGHSVNADVGTHGHGGAGASGSVGGAGHHRRHAHHRKKHLAPGAAGGAAEGKV